ncbi:MAG: DUF1792 domain-containing protein [Richelia sp. RM2_1_2]|nr:DUF1792 domain-containing protein [Richelia sp. RM2_1_2]
MKTFKGDFDLFLAKIKKDEHFALSRWGDGELKILENEPLDLRHKGDGEFRHDPSDPKCLKMRNILMESYKHQGDNYYIGVACQCCVGKEKFDYMRKLSGQPESNLTWANIFVNSNYKHFVDDLLPVLKDKQVILIANRNSKINGLPFKVERFYSVATDAWIDNYELSQHLQQEIGEFNIHDRVYLIAAGPFANILTYELWKYDRNNTYIDIGSTLDKYLGLKLTRLYLQGGATLNKNCIW